MKKITKKELKTILEQHELWLVSNEKEGKRADLTRADLTGVDLIRANLRGACLYGANLTGADLRGANLTNANLTDADLTGADLTGAILTGAILTSAILTSADLTGSNFTGAYLYGSNLTGSNFTGANLTGAYLTGANLTDTILDEKEQCRKGIVLTEPMIGYKKSDEDKIITLEIPIGAKVFSINNNKRRTNKVKVIDMQGETELCSMRDANFKYHVGDEIDIKDFVERYNVECSTGIHFFLTRDEAESFEY